MINFLIFFTVIFLYSCTQQNDFIQPNKIVKSEIPSKKMSRSDVKKMQKKIIFSPKAGDISPQGFNWVHFDFAAFFSGAFYQHNFNN